MNGIGFVIKRQTAELDGLKMYRVVCLHPLCERVIDAGMDPKMANRILLAHATKFHGADAEKVQAIIDEQQAKAGPVES